MLILKNDFKIEDLEKYGFTSFKVNRNQTNYYRIFAQVRENIGDMLLVNNVDRAVVITKYNAVTDLRVHAYPRIRVKDKTQIEDVIYLLVKEGVVNCG